MTLDESASLSPEQLRVAVAERLGWYIERTVGYEGANGELVLDCGRPPGAPKWNPLQKLPNYPESRDACAEFEATLTDTQREKYCALLMPQWDDEERAIWRDVWDATTAEATQRCRAFLAVSENPVN